MKCRKEYQKNYRRSKEGIVAKIYGHQKANSIKRGHALPTYSKDELREWLYSQKLFHVLYDNWKRLDYQTRYKPSVDRKNDYIGYTMSNIQLMTWGENDKKGKKDAIDGVLTKTCKEVDQYDKKGNFINRFHSIKDASRQTGIKYQRISGVCNGKNLTSGGYVWSFVSTDTKSPQQD